MTKFCIDNKDSNKIKNNGTRNLRPEDINNSYSIDENNINEEDKYQSQSYENSEQNIDINNNNRSDSEASKNKVLKKINTSNKQIKIDIKKKYDGQHPSQHGINMNNIDKFGEMNPMFYQYPQMYDRRMLNGPHFSGLPSQQLPFSQYGASCNPYENMPMMNSMPNMIMDPSIMYNSKISQKLNQSSKKQEDTYDMLRDYYK